MRDANKGSAARLRKEAAKARLLAHNTGDAAERERLAAMAAMFEREAHAIDEALRGKR